MGLLSLLRRDIGAVATPTLPDSVSVAAERGVLCAPVTGRLVARADVPDAVFAGGLLGECCGVWPEDDVIYAPLSGEVSVAMGHAVGISADGVEALVHVGLDTVEMNGDGFTVFVRKGERVEAGQPLLRMDREKIRAAKHPDCVILAVSNSDDLPGIELAAEPGSEVEAGVPVLRVTR